MTGKEYMAEPNRHGKYKTKHSTELLDYLGTIPGKHLTVAEICDYFKDKGKGMGTTTVYRHLEKLVDEGLVKKYNIDAGSPACFEYVGSGGHCGPAEECFHCKCEKCGRLIHLQCDELNMIKKHILDEHAFAIDVYRTVFYGLCEFCREPEKIEE